ncbi:MAG: hypothetical protein A3B75_02610 [Candidatus Terrybacteria bacterium RIFCSPHIGHO2_02_FULL_43_14]|nr:MAG: hypothetical protein A3B75_02610 [Candidatus Terrybacteria bacterium RIFCSPHIGHO2_02_FULL_43_14]
MESNPLPASLEFPSTKKQDANKVQMSKSKVQFKFKIPSSKFGIEVLGFELIFDPFDSAQDHPE